MKKKREESREKKKENTSSAAKPKANYLSEFDDILAGMDDDQLAELARELYTSHSFPLSPFPPSQLIIMQLYFQFVFMFNYMLCMSFPPSPPPLSLVITEELGIHGMLTQNQSRGDTSASPVSSFPQQKLSKELKILNTFTPSFSLPPLSLSLSLSLLVPDRLLSGKGNDDIEHPDLEQMVESVRDDDPTLTDLNLNNHPLMTPEIIHQLLSALENNTHITKLSLANIKFNDDHAAVSH